MKSLRTVHYSLIAAAVAGAAVVSTPAAAEISATATVSNVYLWRGLDLGMGVPGIAGSLDYTHSSGLFVGAWGSSAGPGTETDIYAGYEYSSDDFGFKAAVYDYTYPYDPDVDFQEAYLNFSASGFFVDGYFGIGKTGPSNAEVDNKNNYFDLGYTKDKYTLKVGQTNNDLKDTDYTHVDVSYAYNDNLSFTLSGVVDSDDGAVTAGNQDPLFVVSYSLPLDIEAKK